MSRQHVAPVVIGPDGQARTLTPIATDWDEDRVQDLVHRHPECLPIREIDPLFADPVSLCRELSTPAGPIDNVLVTASGLPVLVECKLWRNPQARREVIGQILDYAKELSRWSASDFQREVGRRTGGGSDAMLELVRSAGHTVDQIAFVDALTHNLRRGRFLLLIVGDGIREGVEAISEYLQGHSGLHFSLGLVELPMYELADGSRLIAPRVLARTQTITRTVVVVPEGQTVAEVDDQEVEERRDPTSRISFWTDFVGKLVLDDPEQPRPKAGRQGYVTMPLPVPGGTCWLVSYRSEPQHRVGVYLSYGRESAGSSIVESLLKDSDTILEELGGTAQIEAQRDGRRLVIDHTETGAWTNPAERERALEWLRKRTNDFVNVLRPRVKTIALDLEER